MNEPASPWDAIGVSGRARAMAEASAAQHGVNLGEWVSAALVAAASGERSVSGPAGNGETRLEAVERACRRMLEIAERSAAQAEKGEQRLTALSSAMNELARKAVQSRTATGGGQTEIVRALEPFKASIESLVRQIDALLVASYAGAQPVAAHGGAQPVPMMPCDSHFAPSTTGSRGREAPAEGFPAKPDPVAPALDLDFETLNARALDNTQRAEDESRNEDKGRLMRRVLGAG